jgi:HPt (histidine-containing phosphotransfer) domain-containing protein
MSSSTAHQIDPQAIDALRESMGSDDEMAGLVEIFREQAERDIAAMHAAWPGAPEALGRLAHRLKGSSLSMGAHALAEQCRQLEQRAHAGLADSETAGLLSAVEGAYLRASEALRGLVRR